jgi:hypothetical protein
VPDRCAPEVGPAALRALGAEAFVEDGSRVSFPERASSPLRVWGRVGVECRAVDATGSTDARLAPLRIELTLDGETVFVRHFDRLWVASGPTVQRVYGTLFEAKGPWSYRLYRWPSSPDADATEAGGGDGIIDFAGLRPGRHRLCVEASDAAGGCSELAWEVEVRPPLVPVEWRAAPERSGGWLLGLRLREPVDSSRLPLRLERQAPASRRSAAGWVDAGEWLPLGQGWHCARATGAGPLRVVDRAGKILMPTVQLGGHESSKVSWSSTQVRSRIEEGMIVLEVIPPAHFPGLPRVCLETVQGLACPLVFRGAGDSGGWEFALTPVGLSVQSQRLVLEFGAEPRRITLPLDDLLLMGGFRAEGSPTDSGGAIRCLGGRLTLVPAAGSFYEGTSLRVQNAGPGDSLWIASVDPAGRTGGGLRALSPIVAVEPAWWPLQEPLPLRIDRTALLTATDEAGGRWGLYRLNGQGRWRWVGRQEDREGLGAAVAELGRFAILEDRIAPEIAAADPPDGARLRQPPRRLQVRASDVGSGFDPRNADIELDAVGQLAVWDVDESTLTARLDAPPSPGPHAWGVRVTDRAGNSSAVRLRFEIVGP